MKKSYIFLWIMIFLYGILFFVNNNLFWKAIGDFYHTFVGEILKVLFLITIILFVLNLVLDKKISMSFLNTSHHMKYFYALIWGILSMGPAYMWYPILEKLHKHWLTYGHIATFIYARAVKLFFLVVMASFFGWKYTLIFNLVLIIFAVFFGLIIDFIFKTGSQDLQAG